MATFNQILSDIELRVTAGRNTDEDRFNKEQAAFVFNLNAAALTRERAIEGISISGNRYNFEGDPLLWKTYELDVVTEGVDKYVELPFPPISMPIYHGVKNVFTTNPSTGYVKNLKQGSYSSAETHSNLMFAQPQYVFSGNRLNLYGIGLINKVTVIAVNSFTDFDNIDLDAQYPLSEDMIAQVIQATVQVLLGQQQLPDDVNNNAKDESVKGV